MLFLFSAGVARAAGAPTSPYGPFEPEPSGFVGDMLGVFAVALYGVGIGLVAYGKLIGSFTRSAQ